MLVLETLVRGYEDIDFTVEVGQQDTVFQLVPAKLEGSCHLVVRKYPCGPWVDTSV